MSASGFTGDELRAAVRAVLRDVLPPEVLAGRTALGDVPVEHVVVDSDADLDALVRRLAVLCEDPARRAALREGRHGFRLGQVPTSGTRASGSGDRGARTADVVRVDRGAVTERTVAKAAADGARLVVGRRAVLTPLARDKARNLGLEIEKER